MSEGHLRVPKLFQLKLSFLIICQCGCTGASPKLAEPHILQSNLWYPNMFWHKRAQPCEWLHDKIYHPVGGFWECLSCAYCAEYSVKQQPTPLLLGGGQMRSQPATEGSDTACTGLLGESRGLSRGEHDYCVHPFTLHMKDYHFEHTVFI